MCVCVFTSSFWCNRQATPKQRQALNCRNRLPNHRCPFWLFYSKIIDGDSWYLPGGFFSSTREIHFYVPEKDTYVTFLEPNALGGSPSRFSASPAGSIPNRGACQAPSAEPAAEVDNAKALKVADEEAMHHEAMKEP